MPWYVVRTKPQHEIKSARFLENLGVEVYCPVVTELRQWSDRKKKVSVPLFKSYLFIKPEDNARSVVYEAPGVLNYLYWLNKPAQVREEEITAIKAWLNDEKLGDFETHNLKPGEELTIKNGKFVNQKAIIKEVGSRKLKLILPEMGWTLTAKIQEII